MEKPRIASGEPHEKPDIHLIETNIEILEELIRAVGGPTALLKLWSARFPDEPSRETLYQWRNRQYFPGGVVAYLRFCACLDVDPVVLAAPKSLGETSLGDRLLSMALQPFSGRGLKATDIIALFGPRKAWPSPEMTTPYFERKWFAFEFPNPGQSYSRYETLKLTVGRNTPPRVIHFAYRNGPDHHWRMYGSIMVRCNLVRLFDFFRATGTSALEEDGSTFVQTRFGEGSCDFRLASLHEFAVEHYGDHPEIQCLRFA